MEILELTNKKQKDALLAYLSTIEWGAAKFLHQTIATDSICEKMGQDARIFFAEDQGKIMGFFTLVNQDYIPLPAYDRFIAMVWVDPLYRGRGLSKIFIQYAEEASGVDTMHILTQHKGLYEKMGYHLIKEFTDSIHDHDYLYEKHLV